MLILNDMNKKKPSLIVRMFPFLKLKKKGKKQPAFCSSDISKDALNLTSRIISPIRQDANSQIAKAVKELDAFVNEKLMPILNKASPGNSSEIVDAFEQSLERFEEFTAFPMFESKHIIGVGGAYSSGKSKLLNTIIGEDLLPTETDPTTVVPTFIMQDIHETVGVVNIFNVRNILSLENFKAINYDFINTHDVELRHLIKRAFISSQRLGFEHIALLDTPGYSKPDSETYSDRTDEKVAREQLVSREV